MRGTEKSASNVLGSRLLGLSGLGKYSGNVFTRHSNPSCRLNLHIDLSVIRLKVTVAQRC